MTPQKPLARAKERRPTVIAAWLETAYPAIAKRAKAEGAAIYWGDETGISNQDFFFFFFYLQPSGAAGA